MSVITDRNLYKIDKRYNTMVKVKHNEKFPNNCPNCKSKDLEYEDFDYNSKTELLSQEIRCTHCDKEFLEFFKSQSWSEKLA